MPLTPPAPRALCAHMCSTDRSQPKVGPYGSTDPLHNTPHTDLLCLHSTSCQTVLFHLILYSHIFLWKANEVPRECGVFDREHGHVQDPVTSWIKLREAAVFPWPWQMVTNVSVWRELQSQLPLPCHLQPETSPLQRPPSETS